VKPILDGPGLVQAIDWLLTRGRAPDRPCGDGRAIPAADPSCSSHSNVTNGTTPDALGAVP